MTTPATQNESSRAALISLAVRTIELGSDPLAYVVPLPPPFRGEEGRPTWFGTPGAIAKEDLGRFPEARRLIEFAAPTWASFFAETLKDGSVSPELLSRWAQTSDIPALESAAKKLVQHEASPWIMTENYVWFSHHAGENELRAIQSLTDDEFPALMGEDFYPATADGAFESAWRTKLPADIHYTKLKNAGFTDEIQFLGSIALNASVPVGAIPSAHALLFSPSMDPAKRRYLEANAPLVIEIRLSLNDRRPAIVGFGPCCKFNYPIEEDGAVEAFFDTYVRSDLEKTDIAAAVLRETVAALHAQKEGHAQAMGEGPAPFPVDESGADEDDEDENEDGVQPSRPRG